MRPEQILALAREAGIHHAHDSDGHCDGLTDEEVVDRLPRFRQELEYADKRIVEILERFAALVAKHEREQCAKLVEDDFDYCGDELIVADAIRARWN